MFPLSITALRTKDAYAPGKPGYKDKGETVGIQHDDPIGGYVSYGEIGAGNHGSTLGKVTSFLTQQIGHSVVGLVKSIPFPDKRSVFNIGDYGTADGAASMTFIRDLITTLREHHGPEVQFQVIYEDQATNDFNSLFRRLSGLILNPPSYLLELDNVYPLASGISFHKQCVPTESMHFIMLVAAVHWLSKTPVMYKEGVFYSHGNIEEQELLNSQACTDWESFLLMRSKELKHGGIMLVITTYRDDDDMGLFTLKEIICILTEIWISLRNVGKITNEEFIKTNLSFCPYSSEQLRRPFVDSDSAVSKSGLRLVSAERIAPMCVFYSAWKERKDLTGIDDREEFARSYVAAQRNWSHTAFLRGLSSSRTEKERTAIVDELYESAERTIRKMHPENFVDDVISHHLIIRKE